MGNPKNSKGLDEDAYNLSLDQFPDDTLNQSNLINDPEITLTGGEASPKPKKVPFQVVKVVK